MHFAISEHNIVTMSLRGAQLKGLFLGALLLCDAIATVSWPHVELLVALQPLYHWVKAISLMACMRFR